MQWFGAILPRIHHFVPTNRILELAPGYGRWTKFLKGLCSELEVVDLSAECIDACKQRFRESSNIRYWINDGRRLDMIRDASIDFCFTFDSLVHCEEEIITCYLEQLSHKLAPDGVAFIHHSNIGTFPELAQRREVTAGERAVLRRLALLKPLKRMGVLDSNAGCRATSMTSEKMRFLAAQYNLRCLAQETVNWGSKRAIDCFSTLVLVGSKWPAGEKIIENLGFMDEAARLQRLSNLYGASRLFVR
jgi:SAM-dependent methyltransferase